MWRAATSWARAAISGVGKVPSQMRDFLRGSRISDTHLPQFLIRTPRYTGCLLRLEEDLDGPRAAAGDLGEDEEEDEEEEEHVSGSDELDLSAIFTNLRKAGRNREKQRSWSTRTERQHLRERDEDDEERERERED